MYVHVRTHMCNVHVCKSRTNQRHATHTLSVSLECFVVNQLHGFPLF